MQDCWTFSLYPQAAEGGGCFVPRFAPEPRGGPPDPERSREEGRRRARSKLRRYCAANRLNRFATLTYAASCRDPWQLRADVGEFFRGLRRELGGKAIPYAWTSEWHPGGHGLHVHFTVGRYVRQRLIKEVWGRGIVHIKLIGDLPVGSGALEEARAAGGYLAKYVSKSFDSAQVPGLHRYEVAQGFQPRLSLALSLAEARLTFAKKNKKPLSALGEADDETRPHDLLHGHPRLSPRRASPDYGSDGLALVVFAPVGLTVGGSVARISAAYGRTYVFAARRAGSSSTLRRSSPARRSRGRGLCSGARVARPFLGNEALRVGGRATNSYDPRWEVR